MYSQPELSHISGRNVRPLVMAIDSMHAVDELKRLGICLDASDIGKMNQMLSGAMDAAPLAPLTTASITTPIQFLQSWLPGFVEILTAARLIDTLLGITTQANWYDEEIIQGVMEHTGEAVPYGDYTNIPQSSWNLNFERRTIVRFEEGMMVGKLEEARASAMNVSSADQKRKAAASALEITRNRIGFFGYNAGANRTYGLLNDPELPAYVTVPVGVSTDTEWATKTFNEITSDIRTWVSALRIQGEGNINPETDQITMGLALAAYDYMSVTTDLGGVSVRDWLTKTYPNVRPIAVPEFDGANGGENVAYFYAETVSGDTSSDDGKTFIQVVPTKFQTLGVEQKAKRYVEDYTNATAGVLLKRPFAVYRASGI